MIGRLQGILLEKGEKSDKILVKNCDVNVKATVKANK